MKEAEEHRLQAVVRQQCKQIPRERRGSDIEGFSLEELEEEEATEAKNNTRWRDLMRGVPDTKATDSPLSPSRKKGRRASAHPTSRGHTKIRRDTGRRLSQD